MFEEDAVSYEYIQTGTYRIYNTKGRGFASFPTSNSNIAAQFSSRVESNNIKVGAVDCEEAIKKSKNADENTVGSYEES